MLSFKRFIEQIDEEKLNYNHNNQHWQVRGDDEKHSFRGEKERVVLKNPSPYVDHEAHADGKRVYAYMQGEVVHKEHEPDLSNHHSHPVKFVRGDTEHPFVHAETGKPFKQADYMVFHKNQVTAYHKK